MRDTELETAERLQCARLILRDFVSFDTLKKVVDYIFGFMQLISGGSSWFSPDNTFA